MFFNDQFKQSQEDIDSELLQSIPHMITLSQNEQMEVILTLDEVKASYFFI